MNKTIGFIGAGNMGGAMIKSLLSGSKYKASNLLVSDPRQEILTELKEQFHGIKTSKSNIDIINSDILIVAVKPQIYEKVISDIAGNLNKETIIVTIAAGITLKNISEWLGGTRKVIRTMPNTPALISEGMTGLCPGSEMTKSDIDAVQEIFETVGKTMMMPEHLMDAFTALSGSSPAWVFMLIEALADGAVLEGISRSSAYVIAAQAVMGSAKLVLESGIHPGELKDRVCSPGGTAITAVKTLEKAGFRSAVIQAVEDCTRKSKELGSQ